MTKNFTLPSELAQDALTACAKVDELEAKKPPRRK